MFIFYQVILIKQNLLVYNNCKNSYCTPFMTNGCNVRGRRQELHLWMRFSVSSSSDLKNNYRTTCWMKFPPATCGDGFHCRLLWCLTTSCCVCQSNLLAIIHQSQHSELYDLTSHNVSCYDTERVISVTTPQPFSMGPRGQVQQTSPQTEI